MRKFLLYCASALCLSFIAAKPSVAGPCSPDNEAASIYVPDRGCAQLGFGYQYQHYDVFGRSFGINGYNVDGGVHLVDWLTGGVGRLTVAAEATGAFGFGHTGGSPNLEAKSLFLGGGPHLAIQSSSRLEPWIHLLVGWEHFRFTQTNTIGSNSTFGFMGGGGVDYRIERGMYWRVQADYLGTLLQSNEQSNFSVGTGLILYF
jgi:hypothetical protein